MLQQTTMSPGTTSVAENSHRAQERAQESTGTSTRNLKVKELFIIIYYLFIILGQST